MAPIFASPDIAALVAAFPPPLPTKDRPSLVKSRSGNDLLDSRKVLARFRTLLETSTGRIKKSDLPLRLGIEKHEWLLDYYDGELYYSKDLQSLLCRDAVDAVAKSLQIQAEHGFVDVSHFCMKQDVSHQSCERPTEANGALRLFQLRHGKHVLAATKLVDRTKTQIEDAMGESSGEETDLAPACPSVPPEVLLILAVETIQERAAGGSVRENGDRVVFTPHDYESLKERRQQDLLQAKITAAVDDITTHGYCEVDSEAAAVGVGARTMTTEVFSSLQERYQDHELLMFEGKDRSSPASHSLAATKTAVETTMERLQDGVRNKAREVHKNSTQSPSLTALESTLRTDAAPSALVDCLLQSKAHRAALEQTLISTLTTVEAEEHQEYAKICREKFLIPLELYKRGLVTVDEALSARLSSYLSDHFRNEVRDLVQALSSAGLLKDKSRSKDIEKLTAACEQAKSLADINSAANKFCRKQRIDTPDDDALRNAKREIMQEKLRNIKMMGRASDVLQHLVWILLARLRDGIFISAGKDTSRIIKYYQSIGDAEKGRRLEQWRDALKTGAQTDSDIGEMKRMAEESFETEHAD